MVREKENIWFKAKRYGWGWYPSRWEGWIVLLIYFLLVVDILLNIDKKIDSLQYFIIGTIIPFILLTIILIIVCYLKGEKPRWRWGK